MFKRDPSAERVEVSIVIGAPADRVLRAFFEVSALQAWWDVAHAVTTPRALGPYAVEWRPTDFTDHVLGRLGGVLRGTVMQYQPAVGFFVADLFWLPPDGDPIGPMALDVSCSTPSPGKTELRVVQTGFEKSGRWRRYYEVVGEGWDRALHSLKALLER